MKNAISIIILITLFFVTACNESSNVDGDGNNNTETKKYIFYTEFFGEGMDIHKIDMDTDEDIVIIENAVLYSSPANNFITYTSIDFNSGVGAIFTSDLNGENSNKLSSVEMFSFSVLSNDATKILYFVPTSDDDPLEFHVMNFDGSNNILLHTYIPQTDDYFPQAKFSFDSKKVAFVAHGIDHADSLYTVDCDGTNLELVAVAEGLRMGINWSTDGTKIVGVSVDENHQFNVRSFNVVGSWSELLTNDGLYKVKPVCSPDGSKIAYYQDVCDIHIINSDGSDHRKLTNNTGEDNDIKFIFPTWSLDSKFIVYPSTHNPDGGDIHFGDELRAIDVNTGEVKIYAQGKQILCGYMYYTK